jgi:serine protease SohB
MWDLITTASSAVNGLVEFLSNLMGLGFKAILVAIAFAVLAFIATRIKGGAGKKSGPKLGLFQYHTDTRYDPSTAITSRVKAGALAFDPADFGIEIPQALRSSKKPVALLRFDGNPTAAGRRQFARLVDEVVINKDKFAACAVVASSPGGTVTGYGHMYMQMKRLRDAGIYLIVLIDEYAASGGYLMSLPANVIVAPPLSVIGSIGVVQEFLNFHDLLKTLGVRPMTLTAGKFKRTLSPTGEVTPEAEAKVKEELAVMHRQFIALVKQWRPQIDAEKVCTGEHWSAQEAFDLKLGLIDAIESPEGYLLALNQDSDIIELSAKSDPFERGLLRFFTAAIDLVINRVAHFAQRRVM